MTSFLLRDRNFSIYGRKSTSTNVEKCGNKMVWHAFLNCVSSSFYSLLSSQVATWANLTQWLSLNSSFKPLIQVEYHSSLVCQISTGKRCFAIWYVSLLLNSKESHDLHNKQLYILNSMNWNTKAKEKSVIKRINISVDASLLKDFLE